MNSWNLLSLYYSSTPHHLPFYWSYSITNVASCILYICMPCSPPHKHNHFLFSHSFHHTIFHVKINIKWWASAKEQQGRLNVITFHLKASLWCFMFIFFVSGHFGTLGLRGFIFISGTLKVHFTVTVTNLLQTSWLILRVKNTTGLDV